jgi:glycosyltransferase involved in cell wall biosynthesis
VRVAYDVTPAIVCDGGLRRYVEMLWAELAPRVELRAFALGRGRAPAGGLPLRRHAVPLRVLHPAWRLLGWPRAETFAGPVDVVHATALVPPPTRRPLVVTVHDVMPLTHPQFFTAAATAMQRRQLRAAARAAVVVTTCAATAGEIARVGDVDAQRIVVAPLGVLPARDGDAPPAAAAEIPPGPYLLSVGSLTPRKGFQVLAKAVSRLGAACPPVLLVGPDGWRADEVRRQVRDADRHGRIRCLGAVDDATLRRLYAGALLVCQPSLAEGFGMPLVEAMAFGAALVGTAIPPAAEVATGCALLVPPDDDAALAEALASLLDDPARRRALGDAARAQAAQFTWAATADAMVGAYRQALAA